MRVSPTDQIGRRAIIQSLLCLTLAGLSSCEGVTRLKGTVKDPQGRPIQGAVVSLGVVDENNAVSRANSVQTQSNGFFEVSLTHSPFKSEPLRLRIEHGGYQPFELNFKYGDRHSVGRHFVLTKTLSGAE